MIEALSIKNFRGFENHSLCLRPRTLIVGQNNAGKSSLVEVLRLVATVLDRVPSAAIRNPPEWADAPLAYQGIRPSTEGLGIQKDSIFHRYGDAPAILEVKFTSGVKIKIYVGPDLEVHATFIAPDGKVCRTASAIKGLSLPSVRILPQIGPLREDEELLGEDYVRQNTTSTRASLHFRNQLYYKLGNTRTLNEILERTWPGVVVGPLERQQHGREELLKLIIRDHDFSSEIAWMGSGLQMWIQMAWFLARCSSKDAIILDEPDVYMHADVQRRLVRLLSARSLESQVIIATHSPEIMAELEPENMLVIDKGKRISNFASDGAAAQAVLRGLGSVQNLGFARLSIYRCILFIEGDDIANLKRLQKIVFPHAKVPIDSIPSMTMEGSSGVGRAVAIGKLLSELKVKEISGMVIIDRDYKTIKWIEEQKRSVLKAGLRIHVWEKKEIENYFIVPRAIAACVSAIGGKRIGEAEIVRLLNEVSDMLRESTLAAVTEEILSDDRARGAGRAVVSANKIVNAAWEKGQQWSLVSGKELMKSCFAECCTRYGVNLSLGKVSEHMCASDVDHEVTELFEEIESML